MLESCINLLSDYLIETGDVTYLMNYYLCDITDPYICHIYLNVSLIS